MGRKIRALIVDDDPLSRRVEGMMLGGFGVETKAVENGREAVDLFVAGDRFDLVVMDMEMPVMDGPRATRALRAMGVTSMIVGVTARRDHAPFIAAGLDSCWEKPFNTHIAMAVLHDLAEANK